MSVASRHYPFDTVRFWLTPAIELDFVRRGVFPTLRTEAAVEVEASRKRSLHVLSLAIAAQVLADAQDIRSRPQSQRGLHVAYTRHIEQLKQQLEEAAERLRIAAAPTATRTHESAYSESWYGSRRQLESSGFAIERALPGEDGCPSRSVNMLDQRGYKASAQLVSRFWPDFYSVLVQVPEERREKLKEAKAAEQERDRKKYFAELRLKIAPTTPTAFRNHASETFWKYVRMTLGELEGSYGYRLDESSIERFVDAAAEAFHIIKDGTVSGRSLKEQQAGAQREAARSDQSLQRFLARCESDSPGGGA